jgi:hypothetical protein
MEGCHLLGFQVVLNHSGGLEDGDAPVWPHAWVMYWYHRAIRKHAGVLTTQVDTKGRILHTHTHMHTVTLRPPHTQLLWH